MVVAPEPWVPVRIGWRRPMLGAEIAFAAFSNHMSGRGHGSLSTGATFSSAKAMSPIDFASLICAAWLDVRFNLHPLVAATSNAPAQILDTAEYSLYYPLVTTESALRWAQETVFEHAPQTMSELVASLKIDSPTASSSRASLHFARSRDGPDIHVILVTGHWITDGRGSFRILSRILQCLNKSPSGAYDWGDEVCRLSVPLAIACGRRTAKSGQLVPMPQSRVDEVLASILDMNNAAQPSYVHPPGTHDLPQRKADVIHELCLTELESASLLQLCRTNGVTMTSLLNVLFALAYVEREQHISSHKTVQFPFFAIHREVDLLPMYKSSVGLQLTLSSFIVDARTVKDCLMSVQPQESDIWSMAAAGKKQLVEAKTQELPLTFEHEIVCAILPQLLSGRASALYLTAAPFVTSVGRVTPLFCQEQVSIKDPWAVTSVANSFTLRWYRPVVHLWEWQGRTTIRIVASGEYNDLHSIKRMRDDVATYITHLLR